MDAWVGGEGGELERKFRISIARLINNCGLVKLYSVVGGGVPAWLLKYNFYVILHRKERKAKATEFFAIFAPFAVNQIMKPSPHPFSISSSAPRLHFTGCPSRYAPPALVVRGLAGAFRLFRRSLDVLIQLPLPPQPVKALSLILTGMG
jgi:hypothetical protein